MDSSVIVVGCIGGRRLPFVAFDSGARPHPAPEFFAWLSRFPGGALILPPHSSRRALR